MGDLKYSEYEAMYPETVIIRKEGYFFTVRGLGAVVCHHFFDFKCWKNPDETISMGFGESSVKKVCQILFEESVSHLVLIKSEVVDGTNFNDRNKFNEYINTDISDIPYREMKRAKRTVESIVSDDEKKLCEISIKYIERLLEGHNPVNNTLIDTDTILTDENVQRCFSFVVDVLKRLVEPEDADRPIKNSLKKQSVRNTVATFVPEYQTVIDGMIQDREVKMSEMGTLIRPYLKDLFVEDIETISLRKVSNWLLDMGYLISVSDEKGNKHREASEEGKIIGMVNSVVQMDANNSYVQYRFAPKAQRFVFENLDSIAVYKGSQKDKDS